MRPYFTPFCALIIIFLSSCSDKYEDKKNNNFVHKNETIIECKNSTFIVMSSLLLNDETQKQEFSIDLQVQGHNLKNPNVSTEISQSVSHLTDFELPFFHSCEDDDAKIVVAAKDRESGVHIDLVLYLYSDGKINYMVFDDKAVVNYILGDK